MAHSRKTPKGLTIADLQIQVATQVIDMLKQDGLTWFQRWAAPRPPLNGVSGHIYSGINTLTTSLWLMSNSQTDPRFLSASNLFGKNPAKKVGQMRKGAKGIPILAAGTYSKEDTVSGDVETRTFYKIHYVWHISQLESVDEDKLVPQYTTPLPTTPFQRNADLHTFIANTGATFTDDTKAVYRPATDSIGMPPMETFLHNEEASAEEYYYATLLHELIHWTGAPNRLARPSLANYSKDKTERAREELVAELGAVMLGMRLGVQPHPRKDNASYIQGWVKLLQDTPGAIFEASSAAGQAATYLSSLQPALQEEPEDQDA